MITMYQQTVDTMNVKTIPMNLSIGLAFIKTVIIVRMILITYDTKFDMRTE